MLLVRGVLWKCSSILGDSGAVGTRTKSERARQNATSESTEEKGSYFSLVLSLVAFCLARSDFIFVPTICPWVSEDGALEAVQICLLGLIKARRRDLNAENRLASTVLMSVRRHLIVKAVR